MLRDQKPIRKKIDENEAVPRFKSANDCKTFNQLKISQCIQHGLKKGAILIIWTNALGKKAIIDVCSNHHYELRGEYIWGKLSSGCKTVLQSTKNEFS